MASEIHEWIISEVRDELTAAFEFLQPIYQLGEATTGGRYTCSSSCLTIHMREGKLVQLIDFNGKGKQGIEVTVSDKETNIRAIFSKGSTDEFFREENRSFTDRTLGGVLLFTDFYLIFNPKSSPSKRLTLNVQQFKVIGSEGSATFGQTSKIEDETSLREIIGILNELICGDRDDPPSPLQPQTGVFRESPTSTGFATQVIFPTQTKKDEPKVPPVAEKVRVAPLPGKGAALLAALSKPTRLQSDDQSGRPALEGSVSMSTDNIVSRPDTAISRKPATFQPVMEDHAPKTSSNLETKGSFQHAPSALHSPQPLLMTYENEQVIPVRATDTIPSRQQSLLPGRSERGYGKETTTNPKSSISARRVMTHGNNNKGEDALVAATHDTEIANHFYGLKRVPRSYAHIPEDQRSILERQDSWLQSDKDGCSDYVNVPAEVLENLRCFMDRQADGNREQGNEIKPDHKVLETVDSHLRDFEMESLGSDEESSGDDDTARGSYFTATKDLTSSLLPSLDNNAENVRERHREEEMGEENIENRATRQLTWSASPDRFVNIKKFQGSKSHQVSLEAFTPEAASEAQGDVRLSLPVVQPTMPSVVSHELLDTNFKTYIKHRVVRDYNFPSSSLDMDDDLETDISHAIGDYFVKNDFDIESGSNVLQHLPTATHRDSIVQVEHTPLHNHRMKMTAFQDYIPSDCIIPATFDDASQQEFALTLKAASISDISTLPSKAEAHTLTQTQALVDNDDGIGRGNDSADDVRQNLSHSQTNLPFNIEQRTVPLLKRKLAIEGQKIEEPSKRRSRLTMKSAVINLSQEDRPTVDIREMARAHRHEFISPYEPATAAIADSQQSLDETSPLDIPYELDSSIRRPSILLGPAEYPTAFHKYTSIYPKYRGSQKQFTGSLCYIEWLVSEKKECPSQSLWDDFINTLAAEYMDYAREVRENGVNPREATTGADFFINRNTDNDLILRECMITPSTINGAILSLDPEQVKNARARFRPKSNPTNGNVVISSSTSVRSTNSTPSMQAENVGLFDDTVQIDGQSTEEHRQSGSARGFLPKRSPKSPYFETHSQAAISKHQKQSGHGRRSATRTPRSGRHLPWTSSQDHSPLSRHQDRDGGVSPPFTPKVQSCSNDPGVTKYQKDDLSKDTQDGQRSPIFGLPGNDSPILYSRPKDRTGLTYSTSRNFQVSTTPSTRISKKFASGTRNMSRKNSICRGNGAFKEFLQRRKSAGLLPNTTPKSNICTKRSGDTLRDGPVRPRGVVDDNGFVEMT